MDTTVFHPSLIHFPIAFLLAAFVLDFISLTYNRMPCLGTAAFYLLILGLLGGAVALITGYFFTSEMDGEAGLARDRHELFAIITVIVVIITAIFRTFIFIKKKDDQKNLRWAAQGLLFASAVLVSITGFLGGGIVWNYLIGI